MADESIGTGGCGRDGPEPRSPARTWRRARLASWRVASGERSTIAAISSNGTANMSCSTNASRSAGLSVSSTTCSAIPTESASNASCSGSVPIAGSSMIRSGLPVLERLLAAAPARPEHVQADPGEHRGEPAVRGCRSARCRSAVAVAMPPARRLRPRLASRGSDRRPRAAGAAGGRTCWRARVRPSLSHHPGLAGHTG